MSGTQLHDSVCTIPLSHAYIYAPTFTASLVGIFSETLDFLPFHQQRFFFLLRKILNLLKCHDSYTAGKRREERKREKSATLCMY